MITSIKEEKILKDIENNYDDLSWEDFVELKNEAKLMASSFLKKKNINIKLNMTDLEKLENIAEKKSVPLTSLIDLAVHKYVKEYS